MGLISSNDETFDDLKRHKVSIIEVYLALNYMGAEAKNLCRVSSNKNQER